MNNLRRKRIKDVINKIELFKSDIQEEIEDILADEEFVYDSMPENLQGSLRGEESEDAINGLYEVIDNFSEIEKNLKDII